MPHKDPEKRKQYQRDYFQKYYKSNKEKLIAKAAKSNMTYRKRNKDYLTELKESTPCADCGQIYPAHVMQFDHIFFKTMNVADLSRSSVSIKRLQQEIDSCELVCANCHAIRTHERRMEQ